VETPPDWSAGVQTPPLWSAGGGGEVGGVEAGGALGGCWPEPGGDAGAAVGGGEGGVVGGDAGAAVGGDEGAAVGGGEGGVAGGSWAPGESDGFEPQVSPTAEAAQLEAILIGAESAPAKNP